MKTLFVTFTLLLSLALTGLSKEGATATVMFMRSTGLNGTISKVNAFIDGELVCKLNNYRYSRHEVEAGQREFIIQRNGRAPKPEARPIQITLEAGKTYYVTTILEADFLRNQIYCQEVTESSALTLLPRLVADEKCL